MIIEDFDRIKYIRVSGLFKDDNVYSCTYQEAYNSYVETCAYHGNEPADSLPEWEEDDFDQISEEVKNFLLTQPPPDLFYEGDADEMHIGWIDKP